MSVRTSLSLTIIASVALCAAQLPALSTMTAFRHGDVRAAAPLAMAALRQRGAWLVNATLQNIERRQDEVCFEWLYAYRSRTHTLPAERWTTCIPRPT